MDSSRLHGEMRIRERLQSLHDPVGFLTSLFAHAPVGLAVWNADGQTLLTNKAFLDIFHSEPPPEYNVLKDDVLAASGMLALFQRAFSGETVQVPTFWYDPRELKSVRVTEGRRVAVSMTIFPLFKESGEIHYVAATYKDETAIMLANERLEESEEDLRSTLDSIGDAVVATDAAGLVTRMNPVAELLTGWSRAEARGKKLLDVLRLRDETTREVVAVDRVLREGTAVANRAVLVARDGGERAITDIAAPIRDGQGGTRGVVVAFRDQTEERRAERTAERVGARLQLLAESSRQFAVSSSSVGALLDIVARRVSELIGELCSIRLISRDGEFLEPSSATHHPNPAMLAVARQVRERQRLGEGISGQVAATGKPVLVPAIDPSQLAARTPTKFRLFVEQLAITSLLVVPLTCQGRTLGVISMTRSDPKNPYVEDDLALAQDLADRAALAIDNGILVSDLEARVAERTARIEEARSELETFSYSVAHDLRAPLRGMNGFSAALLEDHGDRLDAEAKDYLNRIIAGARRMGDIIDALLALARVSRAEPRREVVNLSQVAHAVIDQLRTTEPTREVTFVAPEGLTTFGDGKLLRALLDNLLGNAWKFTSRRGGARIELGRDEEDGASVFYVRDNGAGFDMAHASNLFVPFRRLHSDSEFEGTGIGLATVQRIVRRHGGRIWAEGAANAGATFRFTLSDAPAGGNSWTPAK